MIRLGLIGYPLEHSLSPKIHTAALLTCGLQGGYSLFPLQPGDLAGLWHMLELVRSREITGINVTIPHKQSVIPLLDGLTPVAEAIGAVNTISVQDGKLIGDNTDAPAFLTDLKRSFDFHLPDREGSALVLGAGGAARAVVFALIQDGWEVTVTSRRMEQALELAAHFGCASAIDIAACQDHFQAIRLVVNTTPLGMIPVVDQSPWPEGLPFPLSAVLYDLVYAPRETRLVGDARGQGVRATTGLGMLVEQAALAFESWTGLRPSREILFESIDH